MPVPAVLVRELGDVSLYSLKAGLAGGHRGAGLTVPIR